MAVGPCVDPHPADEPVTTSSERALAASARSGGRTRAVPLEAGRVGRALHAPVLLHFLARRAARCAGIRRGGGLLVESGGVRGVVHTAFALPRLIDGRRGRAAHCQHAGSDDQAVFRIAISCVSSPPSFRRLEVNPGRMGDVRRGDPLCPEGHTRERYPYAGRIRVSPIGVPGSLQANATAEGAGLTTIVERGTCIERVALPGE